MIESVQSPYYPNFYPPASESVKSVEISEVVPATPIQVQPSEPKIVQLGRISLDSSDIFQIHLEFDEKHQKFNINKVCTYGLSREFEKLRQLFQEGIEVTSQDNRHLQIKLNNITLFVYEYNSTTANFRKLYGDPLTNLELRLLNQLGKECKISPRPLILPKAMPADLHTHFGGAVSSKLIVEAVRNAKTPIPYPVKYLKEMGVAYFGTVDDKGAIDLSHPETQIAWRDLMRSFSMNPLRVCSFQEMEKVYEWRGPLLKNLSLLPVFLEGIAKDYHQFGVQYIELSLSDIVKPEWMKVVLDCLPAIEAKYSIRIRFLVAIWRHAPKRYMEDIIAQTKAYAGNPYIAGVDFMGHETSSTRDFIWALKDLKLFKDTVRPDFEIRVHATETSCHPDNGLLAVKNGATRVGHCLHGANDELYQLAQDNEVIFEIQSGSNICLFSALSLHAIPISTYLERGMRVTLGTDGFTLYGSTPELEVLQAQKAGVDDKNLEKIRNSDLQYIQKKEQVFQALKAKATQADLLPPMPPSTCTAEDWSKEERDRVAARTEMSKRLSETLNLQTVDVQHVNALFTGKVPILFAGGTSVSWDNVSEDDRQLIRRQLRQFLHHLNPKQTVLITGGTDFGLERIVHELVLEEKQKDRHFTLLGTLATDLQADFSTISKALTHAVIVNNTWYDLAPFILQKIAEFKGIAYFATGGDVVKNMAQISKNLGIEYYLMKDAPGSPKASAELTPERGFSKHDSFEKILLKSSRSNVLRSVTMKSDEAYHYFAALSKKIVTFLGYSSAYEDPAYLQQILQEKLKTYNPQTTIIAAGGTEKGIGAIYPVAKQLGFQTLGIVSTLAKEGQVSSDADFVLYIEDEQWGGFLPNSTKLSPVSEVIVNCSHIAIMCGGGQIAKAEAAGMRLLDKDVLYQPMNKSHL